MNRRGEAGRWARRYVTAVALLAGLGMMVAGAWSLTAPRSFAQLVDFEYHAHFLHDLGAFQIGIGATVLLALLWSDALVTALAGFLVGNTIHSVSHVIDVDLGGHAWDAPALAAGSLAAAVALGLQLRRLGYVVGKVHAAATPTLAPFVRQKTILLTTYTRDGTPRGVPVSIAVDGDHAVIRSFENAAKTRRLRHNPMVEIAPSTAAGRHMRTSRAGSHVAHRRRRRPTRRCATRAQVSGLARCGGALSAPRQAVQDRSDRPLRVSAHRHDQLGRRVLSWRNLVASVG